MPKNIKQIHRKNYRTVNKMRPKRSITDIKIFGKNGDIENLDYIK